MFLVIIAGFSQVAINKDGSSPDSSSVLDIKATDGGLLIPRMATSQRDAISSPATGLMVFDTNENDFYYYNGTVWTQFSSVGDSDWIVSGDDMYSAVSGDIGIGTTTPTHKLEIKASRYVAAFESTDGDALIRLWDNTGYTNRVEFTSRGNGRASIWSNGDHFNVLKNGNVGIGTISPDGALKIETASSQTDSPSEGIFMGKSTNSDYQLQITDNFGYPHLDFSRGANTDYDGRIGTNVDDVIFIGTHTDEDLLYLKTSSIGIGTTAPSHLLHVNGALRSDSWTDNLNTISTYNGRMTVRNNSSAGTELVISPNGTQGTDNGVLKVYGSDYGTDQSNGWTILIDAFGSSGQSSTWTSLSNMENAGFFAATNHGNNTGFHDFVFGVQSAIGGEGEIVEAIRLEAANDPAVKFFADKVTVQEDGNMGIGTTSPQQKLHVSGVMRLEPQVSAPSGALGDLYAGTDGKLYFHNGTTWKVVTLSP